MTQAELEEIEAEHLNGLTPEQRTLIRQQRDEIIKQEELYDLILEELEPKPEPVPGQVSPAGAKKTPATKKTMMRK